MDVVISPLVIFITGLYLGMGVVVWWVLGHRCLLFFRLMVQPIAVTAQVSCQL